MSPDVVYIACTRQPESMPGFSRLEAFADQQDAIDFLRSEYERFRATVPTAKTQNFATDLGHNVAYGIIRTNFTSWTGCVVARPLYVPEARA